MASGKRFVIADMHFGHDSILRFEDRPFKTVEEMDACIIKNWDDVVGKKDKVFVLGDVSFYEADKTKDIISNLNGTKFLVLGNHDLDKTVESWHNIGFSFVSEYPICLDDFFWLSHEPLYLSRNIPYVNIHGHLHHCIISTNQTTINPYNGIMPVYSDINQYVNVSVEQINYAPIDFEVIKERFSGDEAEKEIRKMKKLDALRGKGEGAVITQLNIPTRFLNAINVFQVNTPVIEGGE